MRGYKSLNTIVNNLAKKVLIHSVDYSRGQGHQLRLFATIVYSGTLDFHSAFGSIDPFTGEPYESELVIQLPL